MEPKLTFKQYLESKEKLREAVKNTPKRTAEYSVRKYCKLVIGESKDDKQYINLKPSNKIFVDWMYTDFDNPTPLSIKFIGVKALTENEKFNTYWQGDKLQKWLIRNSREEQFPHY